MRDRKPRPRCTAINVTDGTQCGRRCHDGVTPSLCNIHRAMANGGNISPNTPVQKTPLERIEKIAATDGHANQMQALKILLEDAKAPVEDTRGDYAGIVHRLTLAQRQRLRELLTEIRELKETARTQAMTWDPVHQGYLDAEPLPTPVVPTPAAPQTPSIVPATKDLADDDPFFDPAGPSTWKKS